MPAAQTQPKMKLIPRLLPRRDARAPRQSTETGLGPHFDSGTNPAWLGGTGYSSFAKVTMLVTLVALLCNGPLCLEKIVTTSEQSGITMGACAINAQIGIADRLAKYLAAAFAQTGALPVHAGRDPVHVGNFRRAEPEHVASAKPALIVLREGAARRRQHRQAEYQAGLKREVPDVEQINSHDCP